MATNNRRKVQKCPDPARNPLQMCFTGLRSIPSLDLTMHKILVMWGYQKVVAEDRVTNRSCSATNLNNCGKKCHASMWPGPSLRPNCLGRAPSYPSNLPAASRGGDGSNLGPEVRESHDWSTKYQQLRWYTKIYIYICISWIMYYYGINHFSNHPKCVFVAHPKNVFVRGPCNTLWVSKK